MSTYNPSTLTIASMLSCYQHFFTTHKDTYFNLDIDKIRTTQIIIFHDSILALQLALTIATSKNNKLLIANQLCLQLDQLIEKEFSCQTNSCSLHSIIDEIFNPNFLHKP